MESQQESKSPPRFACTTSNTIPFEYQSLCSHLSFTRSLLLVSWLGLAHVHCRSANFVVMQALFVKLLNNDHRQNTYMNKVVG